MKHIKNNRNKITKTLLLIKVVILIITNVNANKPSRSYALLVVRAEQNNILCLNQLKANNHILLSKVMIIFSSQSYAMSPR